MSELTDRASSLPWEEISKVLHEDFPTIDSKKYFLHIESEPMAAAVRRPVQI